MKLCCVRPSHSVGGPTHAHLRAPIHTPPMPWLPSDASLARHIQAVKDQSTTGGQEVEEYGKFMKHVRDNAPQRLLVWGLGYDSRLLADLNRGGTTLFVEPHGQWIRKSGICEHFNCVTYHPRTQLNTTVATIRRFVAAPHRANIRELERQCFDTILVDSPLGFLPRHPGRAAPIFTAAVDTQACRERNEYPPGRAVTVWVHDCNRTGEDELTNAFLGPSFSETGPKKLRQFRMGPAGWAHMQGWTALLDAVRKRSGKQAMEPWF